MGPDSSSSINLAYLKLPRWRTRCRFPSLVLLWPNHQVLLSYALGNDCSCHDHARKPQPQNEFHKVVPGLSPSSRRNLTKRPNIVCCAFSSVLKVTFLVIKNQHTFLQALPNPDRLSGKVTKIHFIMYSWHNLVNRRCKKKRGKSMENSNATNRLWLKPCAT